MISILRSLDHASRRKKAGLVLAGYGLAVAASVVAGWLYDLRFSPTDQQASGGMIAFGELMFGAGVFAAVSAVPTALGLWWVRRHRGTWEWFSIASLAFALVGVLGVLALLTATRESAGTPAIAWMSVLGIAQVFGAPIWIGGFALFAWLAPGRDLRRRMLVAVAIEIAIGVAGLARYLSSLT
jgi:hypothetical protein